MEHIQFSYGLPLCRILMCYIGENVNWHYGFGLVGIFMLFGISISLW